MDPKRKTFTQPGTPNSNNKKFKYLIKIEKNREKRR